MTQIEQAIAQIAELKAQLPKGACAAQIAMESLCKDEAYNEAIGILKTLLNEQNHANSAKSSKKSDPLFDECLANVPNEIKKEVSDKIDAIIANEDIESEWNRYCDSKGGGAITMNVKDIAKHFAQWQKEQMLKDAVKGLIADNYLDVIKLRRSLPDDKYKAFQSVKVIIIKEVRYDRN